MTFNSGDTEGETGTRGAHCSVLGADFGHELTDMLSSYSQYGNFLFFKKTNKLKVISCHPRVKTTTTKANHEIEYYKLSFTLTNHNHYEPLGIFLSCYESVC